MRTLVGYLPLALEGEWADWRAIGVVLAAVFALIVSIYLLLWSNLGAKVGYLVLVVSLSAWMILLSLVWVVGVPGTTPNTGPRTHEPRWVPFLESSEQGKEFQAALDGFPNGWDEIGPQVYPGNISSQGEFEKVSSTLAPALAALAADPVRGKGLGSTKKEDWRFRVPGEALTPAQEEVPVATIRFYQKDTPLLFGVSIPATDKHAAITAFAYRDKGAVYLDGLYFLIVSVVAFVVHLGLLARHEAREKARAAVATA